jgi:uracil-DNA glycosylase
MGMNRYIAGDGPLPAVTMFIGERPGKVENYRGKPFQGPSGVMLGDYLLSAGLDRANCYVTNVVKDYSEDDPSLEEIERDTPALREELLRCHPRYIGLLGKFATVTLIPWVDDLDMYWAHGLMFGWQAPWGWCNMMPMYHPAAGMHQTSIQGSTAWDFERFGQMVRGELTTCWTDRTPDSAYTECEIGPVDGAAVDTEGSVRHPWCLSWSDRAGNGFVVRQPIGGTVDGIVMHHSLHDLAVLAAMGVVVGRFEDTLLKACLLGVEPHGLKDLARRHLGLKLRHYDELVAGARRERAINYLGEVIEYLNG